MLQKRIFELSKLFDAILVSAEIGSQKSKENIYNKTVKELGVVI